MNKMPLIFLVFVLPAIFYSGCKDKASDASARENSESFQTNVAEITVIISPGDTPRNEKDQSLPAGIILDEPAAASPADYPSDEEYPNPLIKYVGNRENFLRPAFPVDIDFTTFSGLEFDEHFADVMFLYPEKYLGKTIRFVGQYSVVLDGNSSEYKHFVVFDDAAGCCIRFVEFAWNDDHAPKSYPDNLSIIDVAGVFSSYFDKNIEWDFNYLLVDAVQVLKGAEL